MTVNMSTGSCVFRTLIHICFYCIDSMGILMPKIINVVRASVFSSWYLTKVRK